MSDNLLKMNESIFIPDENDEEHEFEIVLPFELDETESNYIAVVPKEQSEEEQADLYVFRYTLEDDSLRVFQIDSDDEWDLIEEVLNTLL